jgi:hypothetical protein
MTNARQPGRQAAWPLPFLEAKETIEPVLRAAGLRFVSIDRERGGSGHAIAEYRRRGERLRLVWEGSERVLWIEAARERDAQIISRWTDIEWILAGTRLPLSRETGEERIGQLVMALVEYLQRGERPPAVARPPWSTPELEA